MVAGNTCITASKAACEETYKLVRNNTSSVGLSNALLFPSAKKYVERLVRDATFIKKTNSDDATHSRRSTDNGPPKRRLAVVTSATKGCPGYHVAEELAVSDASVMALGAGDCVLDVVLVGKSVKKLQQAADSIMEEYKKRHGNDEHQNGRRSPPQLYPVQMNSNSLRSVSMAAQEIELIACNSNNKYQGQLHMFINLGGQVCETYSTTEEGVDVNLGQNYLAPRLLADLLLPLLRAAATPFYKPRLVQHASVGHCRGADFNPHLLRKWPHEGGSTSDDSVVRNSVTHQLEYASPNGGLEMYYRSKMALMADTLALAKEEPMLAVVSCDPGILTYSNNTTSTTTPASTAKTTAAKSLLSRVSSAGSSPGRGSGNVAGGTMGSFLLGLSPSQGARSALRAALDPDFNSNTTADNNNNMYYLHCDGNPWTLADPTMINPQTGAPYGVDEYAEIVRAVGDELSGQLLAEKDCEVEMLCFLESVDLSSSSLLSSSGLGGSSSHHCSKSLLLTGGSAHSHSSLLLHDGSLLGRSYSSLLSQ